MQIASELPVHLAAQVAEEEAKWASGQQRFFHMYEERIVPVILKLAAGGKQRCGAELSVVRCCRSKPRQNERGTGTIHRRAPYSRMELQ